MKNLTDKFLTPQEQAQIDAAVTSAETKTSGEIVCMVQTASYHYPMANVLGAAALSLPAALLSAPAVGGWLWMGTQNMWIFLSLFCLLYVIFHLLVQSWPGLKRRFISRREIDEEVEEAAVTNFFHRGLYQTRDATGVLIFISVFERRVWVLADHGINAKIAPGQWEEIVQSITRGIRDGKPAVAICEAVQRVGQILETHFPVRPDDRDELQNIIVSEE